MSIGQRVRRRAFSAVLSAPSWVRRLAGPAPRIRGQQLDSELWWACVVTARVEPTEPRPGRLRRDYVLGCSVLDGLAPSVPWADRTVLARDGHAIPVRVYSPPGATSGLVYLHGGGFVIGDLESHHALCARIAVDAGIVVVAVDYRCAPEHPFPIPWDDAVDAWNTVRAAPASFGMDGPIAVGGDSAGANLAIWVSRQADVAPDHLWALYPPTDAAGTYPSNTDFGEGLFLTERRKRWFRDQAYPNPADWIGPRAQPLKYSVLHATGERVPTTVVVAGMDVLRDEGEAYVAYLDSQGVPVTGLVIDDQVHGFMNMTRISSCHRAYLAALEPLKAALEPAP